MALPDFQLYSRFFGVQTKIFLKVKSCSYGNWFFWKKKKIGEDINQKNQDNNNTYTHIFAMSLFKIASSFKNINNIYTPISIRNLGNKVHHLKSKKSITSRLKIVAQGPTKPIIPNTEVEPPVFKIMTKHTGMQHGIAKKNARRVADKRGYREPNKLVKKYIKYFVHDKKIRELIDW